MSAAPPPRPPGRWRAGLAGIAGSRLVRKQAAALALLSATTIGIYGVATLRAAERDSRQAAEQALVARARDTALALRLSLDAVRRQVNSVQALPLDEAWLGLGVRQEEYQRLLRLVPAADSVQHRDGDGRVRLAVSRRGLVQRNARGVQGLPVDAGEADHRVHFADPLQPTVRLAFPDAAAPGGGLAWVRLSLLAWSAELAGTLSAPGARVYVVDDTGAVALDGQASTVLARRALSDTALAEARRGPGRAAGLDGQPVLRVAEPLGQLGWQVIAERDWQAVAAPRQQALWRGAAVLAGGLLLAVVVAGVLASRLTRPVRALHRAARRLAQGDLDARVDIRTGDELQELAGQFNDMAAQLRANVANLESQVASRTAELERANRHKSEFLAHMSHELRTPLHAVLGFADVLDEGLTGPLTDGQRECVGHIHASGRHLLALINDVLDLSRIEAGQLELDLSPFDPAELLHAAADLVRQRAVRGGIALQVAIDGPLPPWRGDARRIKQVLLNLLGNAVKFTPSGGQVTLQARADAQALTLSVADTGIGIAPEDQARIFEAFVQVGPHAAGRAEGTGLGLQLVQRLVQQHGGQVVLDSTPGLGSRFTVTLPRLPGPDDAVPGPPTLQPLAPSPHTP